MKTYVCLLRGINVGGHRKIRMQELRELCESLGLSNPVTYLQSGNLVIDSEKSDAGEVASRLEQAILERFGFEVRILIRTESDFEELLGGSPFAQEGADESKIGVVFLADPAAEERLAEIASVKSGRDAFACAGTLIYLCCPDGFARTKLTIDLFERKLKTAATARNWRTVKAIHEILKKR